MRVVAGDLSISRSVLNPCHFTPSQNICGDADGSQLFTVVPASALSALDAGLAVADVKITTANACHLTSHRISSRVAEESATDSISVGEFRAFCAARRTAIHELNFSFRPGNH